ncbi:MAG: Hsp70 family protein, partial [Deltaproteobacteria bacterium]|nr:Hsp70 family protein [Deltaproteobacteria bacterium]
FKVCDEAFQSAGFSVNDVDGVVLVGGPTRLPLIRDSVRHYFGKEPLTGIDPDEVVALGAAIQAAALVDSSCQAFLLDVTPLTLRLATVGGYTEQIIAKNTPVPIDRTRTFTTSRDNQERVKIKILQGESNRQDENESLGEFEFAGFRVARRGEVQIEVTFEIDSNGIVNVSARDPETGQSAATTVSLSGGLSEDEIEETMAEVQQAQLVDDRDLPE